MTASAVLLDTNFTFAANVTWPGGSDRVHVFAENRLHAINTYTTNAGTLQRSEFTYDGFDRWVQIVEKTNGVIGSTKRFIWDGGRLCQERDANNNVIETFFPEGEQISGTNYYFVRDRLGSVEFILDTNGYTLGNYIYDPYGNQTQWQPSVNPDFGFAGYYLHQPSGLYLTWHRAFDSTTGRWLNQDPIGENGGINLYQFVGNNPVNKIDPFGLSSLPSAFWAAVQSGDLANAQLVLDQMVELGEATPEMDTAFQNAQAAQKVAQAAAEAAAKKATQAACEKTAKQMARQIAKDLGKDAQRAFHDMKDAGGPDRTLEQLKADAAELYEKAGMPVPRWMQ